MCPVFYQLLLKSSADPASLEALRAHIPTCPECLGAIRAVPEQGSAPEDPAPVKLAGEMTIE